jgi:signal transduction histidine kinase
VALPGAVEQIIDNLVSNALDAVPDGTEIVVRADVDVDADSVDVHVIDQGPGMDDDARAHAFERFWRPSGDRTGTTGGFGLGLAIVAQLAAHSGGRARLEPGPGGVGLDAVVTLRRASAPSPGNGRTEEEPNLHPTLTSG